MLAAGGFHRPSSKWRKHSFIRASDVEEGLRIGATWVFGGLIHWLPDVASLAHDLSTALSRPTTAELYLTAGGVSKALSPHNDDKCRLVIPLSGGTRFRLWTKPSVANSLLVHGVGTESEYVRDADADSVST